MIFIEKFTNNGDINVVPFKEVVQFCQSLKKQVHSFVEIFVSEEDDLLGVNLQKPAFFLLDRCLYTKMYACDRPCSKICGYSENSITTFATRVTQNKIAGQSKLFDQGRYSEKYDIGPSVTLLCIFQLIQ